MHRELIIERLRGREPSEGTERGDHNLNLVAILLITTHVVEFMLTDELSILDRPMINNRVHICPFV